MKVKFYGTAAAEGVPALFCDCEMCRFAREHKGKDIRTRQQVTLDDKIVIDFPPDTYMHTLDGLDLTKIRHVLFTHSHSDHFDALELVLRAPGFSHLGEDKPLFVYGTKIVLDRLKKAIDFTDYNLYNYMRLVEIKPFDKFKIDDYNVTALLADHMADETCLLYHIEHNGKGYFHGNDTGLLPECDYKALEGLPLDIATLDCCFGTRFSDRAHMGLESCRAVRQRLEKVCDCHDAEFLLTHFSHNVNPRQELLEKEAADFTVAYDGIEIEK